MVEQWVSGFDPWAERKSQGGSFILIDVVGLYSPKQAQKLLLGFKSLTNFLTFSNIQSDSDQGWSRGGGRKLLLYVSIIACAIQSRGFPELCLHTYSQDECVFPPLYKEFEPQRSCLAQRLSWQNMVLASDLFGRRAHTSVIVVGNTLGLFYQK